MSPAQVGPSAGNDRSSGMWRPGAGRVPLPLTRSRTREGSWLVPYHGVAVPPRALATAGLRSVRRRSARLRSVRSRLSFIGSRHAPSPDSSVPPSVGWTDRRRRPPRKTCCEQPSSPFCRSQRGRSVVPALTDGATTRHGNTRQGHRRGSALRRCPIPCATAFELAGLMRLPYAARRSVG